MMQRDLGSGLEYVSEAQNGTWNDTAPGPQVFDNPFGKTIHPAAKHDNRHGTSEKVNTDFTNPANFTKNWNLEVEPAITWDPTNGVDLIFGGAILTLTTPSSGVTVASATNNLTCLN